MQRTGIIRAAVEVAGMGQLTEIGEGSVGVVVSILAALTASLVLHHLQIVETPAIRSTITVMTVALTEEDSSESINSVGMLVIEI
jgi:hypothetical protein